MCSKTFDPETLEDVFYLNREHLGLIADPLRQRILRLLCIQEMSATKLRREIDDAPSNLHYHVDRLREAGLIRLVRTEPRRGATEKYYRAVARAYMLAPELGALALTDRSMDEELLAVVRGMLENSYRTLADSLRAGLVGEGDRTPVITGFKVRTSPERMAELRQELVDWLRACNDANDPEAEVEYTLLALMFPLELPGDNVSS